MAEQLIVKNYEFIKVLPGWAQEFSYKYCSKTANLYIVHGNIRDYLPNQLYEGEFNFVRIQQYIADVLFGNQDIIAFYDRSSGINFSLLEMQEEYLKTMSRAFPGVDQKTFISSRPEEAFYYIERYFLLNIPHKKRIVFIVDYSETLIPNTEVSRLSGEDRYALVTLNRWSHDPIFTQGDVSVVLLTENLVELCESLVRSPSTVKIFIPLPNEEVREKFLHFLDRKDALLCERSLNPQRIAKITSGLNLLNLDQVAAESFQEDKPITMDYLKEKKKIIIENEASGMLEIIETEHDLSLISGHEFVKKRFKYAARAIKQGRTDVLPMGYLISGPVGTGKSFIVTAFAGEIGIPMVRFKNWQSVTERNLEKVLNILKAMSPVGVMVDEADAALGSRRQTGDSGIKSRIFAQISVFMGNTDYRGRIIWFLITSRPDLLPIDLKRQGRAEEHLALFYPETPAEKEELFQTLVRKLKIKIDDFTIAGMLKKFHFDFSGADLEAILIRAKFNAAMDNHIKITQADMEETIQDFIPPTYPHEIELQNLVAVLECTSREMVPKRFAGIDRAKVISEIRDLKILLGERD
ncbi:MAG: AAA family ATPase [Spirochaetales bacterium]|jgi:SpoVK/Ycf46/Vps4 family AAA+-type ATPase|nr:AAA family ATPase [Spirochaetales bacterium]